MLIKSTNTINRTNYKDKINYDLVDHLSNTIVKAQMSKCQILSKQLVTPSDKVALKALTSQINGAWQRGKNALVLKQLKRVVERKSIRVRSLYA
jgi:hypothetical protein